MESWTTRDVRLPAPLHTGAPREMTQTRSQQAIIAPHEGATATGLLRHYPPETCRHETVNSVTEKHELRHSDTALKHDTPPKLGLAQLSHTARRHGEHARSAQ